MTTPTEIIDYWYSERIKKQWFNSTPELDQEILDNYEQTWEQAASGHLDKWSDTPLGCLAVDKKYHHQLQANTVRNYTVLSLIYLAIQIINDKRYKIKKKELKMVINDISSYTKNTHEILND